MKAHRQTIKRYEHNRAMRSRLRTALKTIRRAIESGDTASARAALNDTMSLIDKMSGKGIIHDNAAARYKSRIARRLSVAEAGA